MNIPKAKLSAKFLNSVEGFDDVIRVRESGIDRLWGNAGQASVRRAIAVMKPGTQLALVSKRVRVPRPARLARTSRARKRKHHTSSSFAWDVAEWKVEIKRRSFLAEAAFLHLLRHHNTAALHTVCPGLQTSKHAAACSLHEALCAMGAIVPWPYLVVHSGDHAVQTKAKASRNVDGDANVHVSAGDCAQINRSAQLCTCPDPANPADVGPEHSPDTFFFLLEDLEHGRVVPSMGSGSSSTGAACNTHVQCHADLEQAGNAHRLGGWQSYSFDASQAAAAIEWLAAFHAAFTFVARPGRASANADAVMRVGSGPESKADLVFGFGTWDQGTYWSLRKRQHQHVTPRIMSAWRSALASASRSQSQWLLGETGIQLLGPRLLAAADALDHCINGGTDAAVATAGAGLTLLHGDFKAENLFFHGGDAGRGGGAAADDACTDAAQPEHQKLGADRSEGTAQQRLSCSACDFQWVGRGFGVVDVVYLLLTSVPDQSLHTNLLHHYHDCYYEHLRGHLTTPPFDSTLAAYRLAFLDFARFCVVDGVQLEGDSWDGWMLGQANQLLCRVDGGVCLAPSEYNSRLRGSHGLALMQDAHATAATHETQAPSRG